MKIWILQTFFVTFTILAPALTVFATPRNCADVMKVRTTDSSPQEVLNQRQVFQYDSRAREDLLPTDQLKVTDWTKALAKRIPGNPLLKLADDFYFSELAELVRFGNSDRAFSVHIDPNTYGSYASISGNYFVREIKRGLKTGEYAPEDVLQFSDWIFSKIIQHYRKETQRHFYPVGVFDRVFGGVGTYHNRIDFFHSLHKQLAEAVRDVVHTVNLDSFDFKQLEQKSHWARRAIQSDPYEYGLARDQKPFYYGSRIWGYVRYPVLVNGTNFNHTRNVADLLLPRYLEASRDRLQKQVESGNLSDKELGILRFYVSEKLKRSEQLLRSSLAVDHKPETHHSTAHFLLFRDHYIELARLLR